MGGLWILYSQLLIIKKTTMLKIVTYFSTSVMRYLTSMLQERKSMYLRIIKFSWLRRYLKLSCKELVSETNFLKNPTNQNRLSYTYQINFCSSLLRKEKKEHFANLNEDDLTDNGKFWYTAKLFFPD